MKVYLEKALSGQTLSRAEARAAMEEMFSGNAPAVQVAAFLAALRTRAESVEEIVGFAEAMIAKSVRIRVSRRPLLDTCGTGGDGTGSFNLSTCASFAAAGAGAAVAKHGNRSVSSRCGSADVLADLGVRVELAPQRVAECIEETGIGFLFAPAFHPVMKNVAPIGKELGVRTVFNLLGPLTNPAGATRQTLGVFAPRWLEPMAQALRLLGCEEAMVVCSEDGMDEFSPASNTRVAHLREGRIELFEAAPEDFGVKRSEKGKLAGGGAQENSRIARSVLSGEKGPMRDAVLLNASAALRVCGLARDFKEGFERAAASIDSGKALAALEALVKFSNAGA